MTEHFTIVTAKNCAIFFHSFTIASRPWLVEPPEEPIPVGFHAPKISQV